ncbi:ATP-binding protein [Candidatus Symbiobacter mobilis]|uniref:AAA-ATPase-like domain-containing protein n=1 Tax=Candidatus Symbiobacter mobilis CR TaxID=946483 RepID=U5N9Q4_9BURK|nr:ATP-binding protein [Candidatus Symbiobacter mobilis]AGX88137.1 hypothetical protein Cenrod_2066 [Candidatus Symbiobacter mobilis CR]
MTPRRKLPIGIQNFRQMREEGYYYVDKTGYALDLIERGKYFFLSRPRRFGKSLFLDTIKELYEGHRELFVGLAAEERWDWGRQYPVILLSFAEGVVHSLEVLRAKIAEQIEIQEERFGVSTNQPTLSGRFSALIRRVQAKVGQRVVVLIDEYDKPILENLTDPPIARDLREGLKDLYSVIKGQDASIQFAMLTGVSKFSKVNLFSGLNNLQDITLDARYSALCGYTDDDIDSVFAPELGGLDREEIRRWYNGYNWLGTSVYNPFDLLLLFETREFRAYWFETGTPTFLIDLLAERKIWLPTLGQRVSDAALLSTFDVDNILIEALMFQAGYLTIDSVSSLEDSTYYQLRYPNREVRQSLYSCLLQAWSHDAANTAQCRISLYRLLQANDFVGMQKLFTAFFDSIPYEWFTNNPIARYEGYYASVFYSYFAALGLDVQAEPSSNAGRLDMAVRCNGLVVLFEFKVVEWEPEGRALAQIKEKGYARAYLAEGVDVVLVGVEFSAERRGVVGFEVEKINP